MKANKRSEGEVLIEEYLEAENIKFKSEYVINGLRGDNLPYRKADFYLPNYKTYIEFFGRWNLEQDKERYREKKRIYELNNVCCVYLYPDNLGILNFIFKIRLKKELKKHNKKWELFKFNWELIQKEHGFAILLFVILSIFVDNLNARILFGVLAVGSIILGIKKTFLK